MKIAPALSLLTILAIHGSSVGAAEEYDNDGYPKLIPTAAPGSKPPTVAEWDAVPREVSVKHSTPYNCETKMLREWLRVSCRPREKWTPKSVVTVASQGQQAFVGMFGGRASCVVQVVKGKKYIARYTWAEGTTHELTVDYLGKRPVASFN